MLITKLLTYDGGNSFHDKDKSYFLLMGAQFRVLPKVGEEYFVLIDEGNNTICGFLQKDTSNS